MVTGHCFFHKNTFLKDFKQFPVYSKRLVMCFGLHYHAFTVLLLLFSSKEKLDALSFGFYIFQISTLLVHNSNSIACQLLFCCFIQTKPFLSSLKPKVFSQALKNVNYSEVVEGGNWGHETTTLSCNWILTSNMHIDQSSLCLKNV